MFVLIFRRYSPLYLRQTLDISAADGPIDRLTLPTHSPVYVYGFCMYWWHRHVRLDFPPFFAALSALHGSYLAREWAETPSDTPHSLPSIIT